MEGAMANRTSIRTALLAGAALGAVALGTEAQAGGFFIHEQSAYYQGLSFAGVAAGGTALSSMFWNPATITQAGPGLAAETVGTGIFPDATTDPITATSATGANLVPLGSSGDLGTNAFVPASYYVYGLNNMITLGLGMNAPFGLNTKNHPQWAGLFYGTESDVFSLNFNPAVAIRITDWLSVGVGAQIQYLKIKLHSAFPGSGLPGPFPTLFPLVPEKLRIDGDSQFDFGLTAGITLTPLPGTTIGLGYRSQIDNEITGDIFRPAFVTPVPIGGVLVPVIFPSAFVNFTAEVPLPDVGTVSIRQKIGEAFTLFGTVEWTNWSRLGRIPVAISAPGLPAGATIPGIPTELAFEWEDGWLFSIGGEYQWSPRLALRAGIGFEESPITDRTRGVRLPDSDRLWVSVGATYNWNERLSFDFGYSHVFPDEAPINIVPGNPTFVPGLGTFTGIASGEIDILSVAARFRFAPPAPPPVVRKG
jgi:long-chain fatty acid transport protein